MNDVEIFDNAIVGGSADITGEVKIGGKTEIYGYVSISGLGKIIDVEIEGD